MKSPRPILAASAILLAAVAAPSSARAGGGPMNVMVLYSADDMEATAVAKQYEAKRSLPPLHLCGLAGFKPSMTTIDVATYKSQIQAPLDACLAALPQPDEIDYLVLVRGLPYNVSLPAYAASLEAVLQVHHATKIADGMELAGQGQPGNTQAQVPNPSFPPGFGNPADYTIMNQYASWYGAASTIVRAMKQPASFHRATAGDVAGYHFANNLFIVSSLDGFDYKDAAALVDRGAASDGTFPKAEILCMRGEDDARAARDPECEFVTRMLSMSGTNSVFVDPFDANLKGHTVAGYFTGSAGSVRTAIDGNTFVPGAITDNLTSYGAAISNFFCSADGMKCPESESQTSIARFIRAGATGAHGTVNEPLNNVFPNAGTFLLYTFGYSMGESYFFNQRYLYWQNIHLGDPLATPYGERPKVVIDGGAGDHPHNQPITVHASHPNGVAQIDLYASGKRIAQAMGDTLSYDVTEAIGDKLDLLAVAVATNAPVMRPGWPQPAQSPQPDIQGWITASVVIGPDAMPSGSAGAGGGGGAGVGGGGGGGKDDGGCGCRAVGAPGGDAWGVALGALALVGARLRGARRQRKAKRASLLAATIAGTIGCGSAPPPPPKVQDAPPVQEKVDRGPTSVEGEIGGLNEEAIEKAFASLGVQDCLEQGSQRLLEIGGAFTLKLRINREGSARWAYLSASTLGDRDTEKCLLDRVRGKSWPKPLGGEGIAEKAFEIDPQKQAAVIEEKRLKVEIAKARAAAAQCRHGVRGTFFATVYVHPDGRVATAGVAPPSEKGEDVADCVVEAIRKVRFRPVGGKAAKVSFEIW